MATTAQPVKNYSDSEIKEKVNQLLLDTGLDGVFPFPAERLANMLGYSSHYFLPSEKTRSISGAVEHNKNRILINKMDPLARQFFTLAHEIGHIVLHKNKGNKIDFRTSLTDTTDPVELEANQFAAELLMPEEEFKKKWKEHKDLELVSAYFGVSIAAAKVRADKLNLKKGFFI